MTTLNRFKSSAVVLATVAGIGFLPNAPVYAKPQPAILTSSAVAVADKYSADAAERIFKEGGNAIDAAVAIAFTLAVTYPEAGNIGGGGFMTIWTASRTSSITASARRLPRRRTCTSTRTATSSRA